MISYHIGTSCLGYELYWVRVVLGTSCPGYELSWVRVVLGTSCPGYELSWVRVVLGTSCPGSIGGSAGGGSIGGSAGGSARMTGSKTNDYHHSDMLGVHIWHTFIPNSNSNRVQIQIPSKYTKEICQRTIITYTIIEDVITELHQKWGSVM